ncbi:hypothetical protein [Comamonas testosteroni]|nr:hypothetical protein [Comamonas testosteroni]
MTNRLQSPALQASLATRPLLRPFLRLTETAFYQAGQHGESEPGMSLTCLAGACEAMRGAAAMKSLKALAGSSIVIACSAAQVDKADQTAKTNQFAQVNQPAQASQPEDAWHINQHAASCTPSAFISANGNVARNGKKWNEENLGLGIRLCVSQQFVLAGRLPSPRHSP